MKILSQTDEEGGESVRESLTAYCARAGDSALLDQWDQARNGPLDPDRIPYGSTERVWWTCEAGHHWQAMVKSRTRGSGCPVCAHRVLSPGDNDLGTTHPALAAEWDWEKNAPLTPRDVMAGTRRKAWWRCTEGHRWQAAVGSRAEGKGCPVCGGKEIIPGVNDLASQYPEVARQWHSTKNGTLHPETTFAYSNRRVWWRCDAGHEYRAPVSHRTMRQSGCPYCAGRKVLPGFNDLAFREPEIAVQWDPELNAPLTPEMVTAGARRKVWWRCGEGHVWKAMIYSRTGAKRCGCPVCAGVARPAVRRKYPAAGNRPAV